MTARLQELANPNNIITRNIRFIYRVNTPVEDALGPRDFVVEAIVGERYTGRSKSPTHYLLQFRGFGPDRPEWTSAGNLKCPDLLRDWMALPKDVRRIRTEASVAMMKESTPPKLDYKKKNPSPPVPKNNK